MRLTYKQLNILYTLSREFGHNYFTIKDIAPVLSFYKLKSNKNNCASWADWFLKKGVLEKKQDKKDRRKSLYKIKDEININLLYKLLSLYQYYKNTKGEIEKLEKTSNIIIIKI